MNSHLSSEQLERALAGRPAPEVMQHLKKCARCNEDIAATGALLAGFRNAATGAAEKYRRLAPARASKRVPRMAWALAAAALFVGVGAPLAVHRHDAGRGVPAQVATEASAISDEALLENVQDDLSSSVPKSLLPLADTSTNAKESTSAQQKNYKD
jgi:hypothetical protein